MSNIYLYPKLDNSKLQSPNPYVNNLEAALARKHTISNKTSNSIGVFDMYKHLFKTDLFFINWIEYMPKQKFGRIQTIFYITLVHIAKLMGKKFVWVLHNKYSHKKLEHTDGANSAKRFLFEFMIKHAHFILTHSYSGVEFLQEKFPRHTHKVKYVIHPLDKLYPVKADIQKKYDLLIWGTIHPYKGVIEFLEYASHSGNLENTRVIILGICPDKKLKNQLNQYLSDHVIHHDKFCDFEEIAEYANQSRYVLFTYNSDSVLSSGSLMDSISMGASIIGPHRGAFKDLNTYSFVNTYHSYADIFHIIQNKTSGQQTNKEAIEQFFAENRWDNFYDKIDKEISQLFI